MTRIESTTATVWKGWKGRRFLTKRAAAMSVARGAYREKYDIHRCACSQETGPCDWCNYFADHMTVITRYARILASRPGGAA